MLHWGHTYLGFANFLWCMYNFLMASFKNPGVITAQNQKAFNAMFPPDDQIFFENNECSTCQYGQKPGRSKHCSLCGWCVAKFDHHCIWVNNCIGIGNHYYFMMFLLSNAIICAYGCYLGGTILYEYTVVNQLFNAVFIEPHTQERLPATSLIVAQYLLHVHRQLAFVVILCAVMAVVLIAFFGWHLYLILRGTTSNEMMKWKTLRQLARETTADEKKKYAAQMEAYEAQQAAIKGLEAVDEEEEILEKPSWEPREYEKLIENLYHRGCWGNLKLVIWPPDFHSDKWIAEQAKKLDEKNGGEISAGGSSEEPQVVGESDDEVAGGPCARIAQHARKGKASSKNSKKKKENKKNR